MKTQNIPTTTFELNPHYNQYKHNLDEEFLNFLNQLYSHLEKHDKKIHKFFLKINSKPEKHVYENNDFSKLILDIDLKVLQNPNYFEKPINSFTKSLVFQVSKFTQTALNSLDSNLKTAENVQITKLLFQKIEPFRNELFENFGFLEQTIDVDIDSEKTNMLFRNAYPLLKQYKKVVYKIQEFGFTFPVNPSFLTEAMSKFTRETLDLEDLIVAYTDTKTKLLNLQISVENTSNSLAKMPLSQDLVSLKAHANF